MTSEKKGLQKKGNECKKKKKIKYRLFTIKNKKHIFTRWLYKLEGMRFISLYYCVLQQKCSFQDNIHLCRKHTN